jgi:hypothetical protein
MVATQQVGKRVRRREDPRLITGGGVFVDDLDPPGCVHLAILRSVHGHATIGGSTGPLPPRTPACWASGPAATSRRWQGR